MDAERFAFRNRTFLRFSLPEGDRPDGRFSVAETLAGRYGVGTPLAVGEASVVLLARDLRTHREVLIKAVRSDSLHPAPPGADPLSWRTEELRRARHALQTERRLLVRLRNAGINAVPHPNDFVYDLNADLNGLEPVMAEIEPYLILERLDGITLDSLIAREFPRGMAPRRAVRLLLPAIRAMAELERPWTLASGATWHVVYQDFKPSNLLVGPDGSASLLDFGGCQVVVNGVPVLEGAHTAGYSPPECHGPPRVLLPCADVYTIGTTLVHALGGIDPRERFWRHVDCGLDPMRFSLDPGLLPRSVPGPLRSIVADCLAPRPSDRPADAGRVADRLASWLESSTNDLADKP